jgi:hypothetical protein
LDDPVTAVVAGPYEHAGAYAGWSQGQFWDTTGTPPGFCKDCEHSPCVAGSRNGCTASPRMIVARRLGREIDSVLDQGWSKLDGPLYLVFRQAVRALTSAAYGKGIWSEFALNDLAELRDDVRKLVES